MAQTKLAEKTLDRPQSARSGPFRPSLGRIVHLYRFGAPPCCAIVTGVIDADHINVVAFEVLGLTFELDVPFWSSQDGREPVVDAGDRVYWIWPPVFQ